MDFRRHPHRRSWAMAEEGQWQWESPPVQVQLAGRSQPLDGGGPAGDSTGTIVTDSRSSRWSGEKGAGGRECHRLRRGKGLQAALEHCNCNTPAQYACPVHCAHWVRRAQPLAGTCGGNLRQVRGIRQQSGGNYLLGEGGSGGGRKRKGRGRSGRGRRKHGARTLMPALPCPRPGRAACTPVPSQVPMYLCTPVTPVRSCFSVNGPQCPS